MMLVCVQWKTALAEARISSRLGCESSRSRMPLHELANACQPRWGGGSGAGASARDAARVVVVARRLQELLRPGLEVAVRVVGARNCFAGAPWHVFPCGALLVAAAELLAPIRAGKEFAHGPVHERRFVDLPVSRPIHERAGAVGLGGLCEREEQHRGKHGSGEHGGGVHAVLFWERLLTMS